ncbi:MAG: exo-alpha-sialidase [Synergistales bacterium]|nr:exo-alpha-sialidase [Synergistales bacterium]
MSAQLHVYMADMGIDHKGTLHLLFDDMGNPEGDFCLGGCADIYYRHSKDEGQSWSTPLNLSQSPTGSSREQLKIDAQGALYVTWDEGWDRLSGVGAPIYSVYRASLDGGISWSAPLTITYPTTGTAQLTAGADGQGGVLLVWRNTELDDLFYQWSTDYGQSWSNPASVPGIFARPWTIPFDLYDMATDSAGIIHLLAVGRQSPEENAPLGLYHLSWDGHSWSAPNCVFCGFGFPEYPRLVISEGNHLHAVWFVRDYLWELGNYEVWYSESYSQAPQQTPIPLPTPTLTPTQTIIPPATPSPTPTFPPLSSDTTGIPEGLKTESDDVLQLLVAIAPLALILTVMFILRRSR